MGVGGFDLDRVVDEVDSQLLKPEPEEAHGHSHGHSHSHGGDDKDHSNCNHDEGKCEHEEESHGHSHGSAVDADGKDHRCGVHCTVFSHRTCSPSQRCFTRLGRKDRRATKGEPYRLPNSHTRTPWGGITATARTTRASASTTTATAATATARTTTR